MLLTPNKNYEQYLKKLLGLFLTTSTLAELLKGMK